MSTMEMQMCEACKTGDHMGCKNRRDLEGETAELIYELYERKASLCCCGFPPGVAQGYVK